MAETAAALASFASDPVALVTAARRVVSRQSSCAPLWNLCAVMLCSSDPRAAAAGFVAAMDDDETVTHLAGHLEPQSTVTVCGWPTSTARALAERPDVTVLIADLLGEGTALAHQLRRRDHDVVDLPSHGTAAAARASDMVIVEALATGSTTAIVAAGSVALAASAKDAGTPVILVAPFGVAVAASTWDALVARRPATDEPWEQLEEDMALSLADRVVGPHGVADVPSLARREDGPVAVELHRPDIT